MSKIDTSLKGWQYVRKEFNITANSIGSCDLSIVLPNGSNDVEIGDVRITLLPKSTTYISAGENNEYDVNDIEKAIVNGNITVNFNDEVKLTGADLEKSVRNMFKSGKTGNAQNPFNFVYDEGRTCRGVAVIIDGCTSF